MGASLTDGVKEDYWCICVDRHDSMQKIYLKQTHKSKLLDDDREDFYAKRWRIVCQGCCVRHTLPPCLVWESETEMYKERR